MLANFCGGCGKTKILIKMSSKAICSASKCVIAEFVFDLLTMRLSIVCCRCHCWRSLWLPLPLAIPPGSRKEVDVASGETLAPSATIMRTEAWRARTGQPLKSARLAGSISWEYVRASEPGAFSSRIFQGEQAPEHSETFRARLAGPALAFEGGSSLRAHA